MTLVAHPRFDVNSFFARWKAARVAALRPYIPPQAGVSEEEILTAVPETAQAEVLRAVFDHSRKLGRSLARFLD